MDTIKGSTAGTWVLLAFLAGGWFGFTIGQGNPPEPSPSITQVVTPTPDAHEGLTKDNCHIKANEARLKEGKPQFSSYPKYQDLIQKRAAAIDSGETTFSHDEFEKLYLAKTFSEKVGELLTEADSCTKAIDNLLASPTHRDILLGDWTALSIGISGRTVVLWVFK